jgi:hypothetical protein
MYGNNRVEEAQMEALYAKADAISHWLREHAPYCEASQKHLEEGTAERAYWHFGYVRAVQDCLRLLTSAE